MNLGDEILIDDFADIMNNLEGRLAGLEKRVRHLEDIQINRLQSLINGPPKEDPADPENQIENLQAQIANIEALRRS